MVMSLGNVLRDNIVASGSLCLVKSVRVEGLVGDDVILDESFEILLAVVAEQEGVDLGPELAEGDIGWSKEGTASVVGLGDCVCESSLDKSELERAELGGEELEDLQCRWGRQEKRINGMDDTIGTELSGCQWEAPLRGSGTYNVDSNNLAIEIDVQASCKTKSNSKSLWLAAKSILTKDGWNGMGHQNTTSWVEVCGDMIC